MRVTDITAREVPDGVEWSARITFADQERTLRFGGPADLVANADASMFLAAALLPAMAWGQDLEVDGPVSARFLGRVDRIARMYQGMDPSLRPPQVRVAEEVSSVSTGSKVAAMFSRGVDSTYTASVPRTEPGPLDELVHCRTLEPVHDDAVAAAEVAEARAAAAQVGLPLREIWTDLRTFTDPMFGWSSMHGIGLGAMAMLVGQAYDHVVVATAYDLASSVPCGSTPALDRMFGTEAVNVYHDDLDRSRQAKVDWLVAERPDLIGRIKVCYSDNRVDNCGRCHKCLLTMANLRAAGGLHLATGFPDHLDLDLIRAQRVVTIGVRGLWVGVAHAAAGRGDRELADAVGDLLRQSAVPPIRELLRGRSTRLDRVLGAGPSTDPERPATFECFDRVGSAATLALLRHGEVLPPGGLPEPNRLRASTVVASLAASAAHRRAARRART